MNRCPITYEPCADRLYSARGLRQLSPRLCGLQPFPYSAPEQIREAALRAGRMSVQGVQPKLSVRLDVLGETFIVVDRGGRYLLKPQNPAFPELPENEDLTMRLAAVVGIEIPLHGLVYCRDGSRTYFIRRFDRIGRAGKLPVEDFAQLAGKDRETKYDSSMERLVDVLGHCTFPAVARLELFRRCMFNFLTGNEDMHLKNYSLIRREGKVELAPGYDLVNTTAAYRAMGRPAGDIEESALPLRGRKRKLSRSLWLDYYARDRLGLNEKVIEMVLQTFAAALPRWRQLIEQSFLSTELRTVFAEVLDERIRRSGV